MSPLELTFFLTEERNAFLLIAFFQATPPFRGVFPLREFLFYGRCRGTVRPRVNAPVLFFCPIHRRTKTSLLFPGGTPFLMGNALPPMKESRRLIPEDFPRPPTGWRIPFTAGRWLIGAVPLFPLEFSPFGCYHLFGEYEDHSRVSLSQRIRPRKVLRP